jgi:hypothetical protein
MNFPGEVATAPVHDDPAPVITPRQRFVTAFLRRKELEAELREVKDTLGELEEGVLEGFLAEGMSTARIDGVTIYLQRQLWTKQPEDVERLDTVRALEEHGWEEFTTYNTQSLSAQVRELAKAATGKDHPSPTEARAAIPDALRPFLDVEERVSVRARRS